MRPFTPFLVLAVAACSGGGSSATAPPTARIDDVDPRLIAGAALEAVFAVADNAVVVTNQLEAYGVATVAVPGPEGGEVVLALDDRDGDGAVTSGDVCTAAFANFGVDGRFLAGVAVIDGIAVQGPLAEYQTHVVDGRLRFLGLSIATAAGTSSLTGTMALRREVRPTVRLMTLTALADVGYGEAVLRTGTRIARNEYLSDGVSAWADGTRGWFVDGDLDLPLVDGTLAIETTVPFTGLQILPAPYGGALEIEGRAGSTIVARMTNFSGGMVIEVDGDGDRRIDATVATTWFDL